MLPFLLLLTTPTHAETSKTMQRIGSLVFQNECASKIACLTSWNEGEEFASLGIGHFIWYPQATKEKPFDESFPKFILWLQQQNIEVPSLLLGENPWPNRQSFLTAMSTQVGQTIRTFLRQHMDAQVVFMQLRLNQALPTMLQTLSPTEQAQLRQNYQRLATTVMGSYILLDYVNFKGEGVKPSERYQGQGWGLLQVLLNMQSSPRDNDLMVVQNFVNSAKAILEQRVRLAPSERHEARWLKGWKKRLDTYLIETKNAKNFMQPCHL